MKVMQGFEGSEQSVTHNLFVKNVWTWTVHWDILSPRGSYDTFFYCIPRSMQLLDSSYSRQVTLGKQLCPNWPFFTWSTTQHAAISLSTNWMTLNQSPRCA